MGKKLHIYYADDITRSVLDGVAIKARCGLKKVQTRELVDEAAASSRPVCRGCANAIAELTTTQDVTLLKREGWLGSLERQARTNRSGVYRFTIQANPTTWNYSAGDWPIAG